MYPSTCLLLSANSAPLRFKIELSIRLHNETNVLTINFSSLPWLRVEIAGRLYHAAEESFRVGLRIWTLKFCAAGNR